MFQRILVPLDGTHYSDYALPHAIAIAARTGATLELVHVHHHHVDAPDPAALPQYQFQHVVEANAARDDDARATELARLEAMADDIELLYGLQVRARVLSGHAADAIGREAAEIVADLIVMSTHARAGIERVRFGSVTHELIGTLNVPALCVHPANDFAQLAAPEIRRVLIPVDGSAFSEQILDVVAPLVRALNAQATLAHVVGARPLFGTGLEGAPQPGFSNRASAIAYLRGLADRCHDQLANAAITVTEATEPASSIAQLIRYGDFDMVALATHGRGGLSRLFLGSVAEKVLRFTNKPVLIYRPRGVPLPADELQAEFRTAGD